jgi:hypothetical protein
MSEQPPVKWLTRWKALGLSVLAFVLISVALFSWYYYSTADLVRVRAEAKALGIPTTWPETGIVVSSPEVIEIYKRIGALSASLKDYDSLARTGKIKTGKADLLKPYQPIPQTAFDHHASLDPVIVAEYLDLVDHLPREAVVLLGERTVSTNYDHIGGARQIVRYQGERILLAAPEQVAREVDRALHYAGCMDAHSWIELLVTVSCINITMGKSAQRLTDLKSRTSELADRLDRLANAMGPMQVNAFIGEFLIMNEAAENGNLYASLRGQDSLTTLSLWQQISFGLVARAGRESFLRHQIEWIKIVQRSPSPTDLILSARRMDIEEDALRTWVPNEALIKKVLSSMSLFFTMTVQCQLRLRLMAAELRGQPWPIDPYDPSGKPLRPFLRDGKLMGAYSVYADGVDDGGAKRKDRYFPLYGPLEAPVVVAEP